MEYWITNSPQGAPFVRPYGKLWTIHHMMFSYILDPLYCVTFGRTWRMIQGED